MGANKSRLLQGLKYSTRTISVKADDDDELNDFTNVFMARYAKSSKPRFSSYFENFGLNDLFLLNGIISDSTVWRHFK